MSSNSPHLAILGAGPIGLEAALAATERGWSFTLYEAGDRVADAMRRWGHIRLFSPWSINVSARARRVLEGEAEIPDDHECPTGDELVDRVLDPLARTPQIHPHLKLQHRVLEIGRRGFLKGDAIGTGERDAAPFRLLIDTPAGEQAASADVVLDCTGVYGQPNPAGADGIRALGETAAEPWITRHLPDFQHDPSQWANQRILLLGSGASAKTAARALAQLVTSHPQKQIVWAMRSDPADWRLDPDDPLHERQQLLESAISLIAEDSKFEILPNTQIQRFLIGDSVEDLLTEEALSEEALTEEALTDEALTEEALTEEALAEESLAEEALTEESVVEGAPPAPIQVELVQQDGALHKVTVDRVLALTGYSADNHLYRQLQVHECYATGAPMKLSAALLSDGGSADCLQQPEVGAEALTNPEPGFFILGAKSYGRNPTFLMRNGFAQVDEVFDLLVELRTALR